MGTSVAESIEPAALAERLKGSEPAILIDVRTPAEFAEIHATSARSVPLDRLDPEAVRSMAGTGPIYVICRSGARGRTACDKLRAAGLGAVVNVEGGTLAWEKAGLPVERSGKTVMSLERQVRIAAGGLVVLGTALGWLVHPGFFGLAGFVGAGLVFAGITDTCAMGMLIARMPWNQAGAR